MATSCSSLHFPSIVLAALLGIGCASGNDPGAGGATATAGAGGATATAGTGGATATATAGAGGAMLATSSSGTGGPKEICGNGFDDTGDGLVDEGCDCTAGAAEPCFPGDSAKAGKGACVFGTQTCAAASGEFPGNHWGACVGAGAPVAEACNGVDDDCNGLVDEVCVCKPGETKADCYSGPAGTLGMGACHAGTQTCLPDGMGWSACAGEVTPVAENCSTASDDDCDGLANDGCFVCAPESVKFDIPAGTTGGPACITTGGGKCVENVTCTGGSCTGGPCGQAHCGTLTCNDGSYTMAQYCSVVASCNGAGIVVTAFTW